MRNTVTHPLAPPVSRGIPFIILLLNHVREYITAGTTAGQLARSTCAKTRWQPRHAGRAASCRDATGCELAHRAKDASIPRNRIARENQPRTFVIESAGGMPGPRSILFTVRSSCVRPRAFVCEKRKDTFAHRISSQFALSELHECHFHHITFSAFQRDYAHNGKTRSKNIMTERLHRDSFRHASDFTIFFKLRDKIAVKRFAERISRQPISTRGYLFYSRSGY